MFDFIDPMYVPVGWTTLSNPGTLGVENCRFLLMHWWKRQQEGLIPFEFHNWEIVPPVLTADGITIVTAAQMAPREEGPLFVDSSDASKEPKKPKAPRQRKRKNQARTKHKKPTRRKLKDKRSQTHSPSKAPDTRHRRELSPSKPSRTLDDVEMAKIPMKGTEAWNRGQKIISCKRKTKCKGRVGTSSSSDSDSSEDGHVFMA